MSVGYSRLTGLDEEGTHARLRDHLRSLVDPKIAEHRGRIVKNTGDGRLAEFGSIVDAVRCAVAVQRGMAERNTDVPREKRIEFRIGINLGDIIIDRGEEVYRIAHKPENVRASLRGEIDGLAESFSVHLSGLLDPRIMAQLHRLTGVARDSLGREGSNAVEDARASVNEIRAIVLTDLAKRPDFWIHRFESLSEDRHLAADKAEHDRLVREGETCVARQDMDRLRQLTFELSENMVKVGGPSHSDLLAGLMRA
jgi:hypothetical protein